MEKDIARQVQQFREKYGHLVAILYAAKCQLCERQSETLRAAGDRRLFRSSIPIKARARFKGRPDI